MSKIKTAELENVSGGWGGWGGYRGYAGSGGAPWAAARHAAWQYRQASRAAAYASGYGPYGYGGPYGYYPWG